MGRGVGRMGMLIGGNDDDGGGRGEVGCGKRTGRCLREYRDVTVVSVAGQTGILRTISIWPLSPASGIS
jgi:hypothetical protein